MSPLCSDRQCLLCVRSHSIACNNDGLRHAKSLTAENIDARESNRITSAIIQGSDSWLYSPPSCQTQRGKSCAKTRARRNPWVFRLRPTIPVCSRTWKFVKFVRFVMGTTTNEKNFVRHTALRRYVAFSFGKRGLTD